VHVIHQLAMGGLENGLVNLINRLPAERYRHAIVCMADFSDFRKRIKRDDVAVHAMHKNDIGALEVYERLFRLFRQLKPAIVHSRNLSGLDGLLPALLAGVPYRVHGEHGRDVDDLNGENRRLRWMRRVHRPLVSRYVCVSKDLERYLVEDVGVPKGRVSQVYNGVDTDRFRPVAPQSRTLPGTPWGNARRFVIGTVGRLQPVKNQMLLLRAFRALLEQHPDARRDLGLAIVGDGPEREAIEEFVVAAGIGDCVWLAGARDDIADLLPHFDVFVLPSMAEGISNTILEAMACGQPIIATAVGGNVELVVDGATGRLVPAGNMEALANALHQMYANRNYAARCGAEARARAQSMFSLTAMVGAYDELYSAALWPQPARVGTLA
jgi:sugar transferase (PEP-CTERM/EpsH1 system associated)